MAASVAALVLAGVFFYPDLQKVIFGSGEGQSVATAGGSGTPAGDGAVTDPAAAASAEKESSRKAFRSKIILAVQIGLRAEAGKE